MKAHREGVATLVDSRISKTKVTALAGNSRWRGDGARAGARSSAAVSRRVLLGRLVCCSCGTGSTTRAERARADPENNPESALVVVTPARAFAGRVKDLHLIRPRASAEASAGELRGRSLDSAGDGRVQSSSRCTAASVLAVSLGPRAIRAISSGIALVEPEWVERFDRFEQGRHEVRGRALTRRT